MSSGQDLNSTVHKCQLGLLKSILGVKRSTTNWTVLRECGHEPLQLYWFRAMVKFYNIMLGSNNNLLQLTSLFNSDRVRLPFFFIYSRMKVCSTEQVRLALQHYFSGSTLRMVSQLTHIPKSTIHGWTQDTSKKKTIDLQVYS